MKTPSSITLSQDGHFFHLTTKNTSYVIETLNNGRLVHRYYGSRICCGNSLRQRERTIQPVGFFPILPETDDVNQAPNTLRLEYPCANNGDFRQPALDIVSSTTGRQWCDLRFKSAKVEQGKYQLHGLPQSFDKSGEASQLQLTLEDTYTGVEVLLLYTVFPECDTIVRSSVIKNIGQDTLNIRRAMSASIDFIEKNNYDFITFHGHWSTERHLSRSSLHSGIQSSGSICGSTGHCGNPSFMLSSPGATETTGKVFSFVMAYSSNHLEMVEVDDLDMARAQIGINPHMFSWELKPGESFETPEAFLSYSANGFEKISLNMHDFMRSHLIRSSWNGKPRPILINNWEATFFDFTTQKILDIAKVASKIGIEMLVLDDGWFGKRNDDTNSLGDWYEFSSKIGDMRDLASNIHQLGMKFGLWFEPEMISYDSDLYRAHPEWVLHIPGFPVSYGRHQLVLDMSRQEVVEHLFTVLSGMIRKASIDYIKWDMNRTLTEVFSAALPESLQGEVFHRFMLGSYQLHERLIQEFPNLLIEGCSGGGGRFDAGMLYYTPQIWCSDNTDAMDRLSIQAATSMLYPVSAMGAHINAQHIQQRFIPFKTRGNVAMAGTFGFELDLTKCSEEDLETSKALVNAYHEYHDVISEGDYYRLSDAFTLNEVEAWQCVSKDKSRSVLTVVRRARLFGYLNHSAHYELRGLSPDADYDIFLGCEKTPIATMPGDVLMNCGFWCPELENIDCDSVVYRLERK